jgi:dihydrofolate synthase/folylpolyglutamate synthase
MESILKTATQLNDYPSVRDFLYALRYHGAKYGLERMEHFHKLLGRPAHHLRCIHVAGTNGKGSTCAMLESIYRHQGYRTGLYTSPHLVRQGERIQVDRKILDENDIVFYTRLMVGQLLSSGTTESDWPSFFEFMTAMAFLKFRDEKVDLAVIETGLGGRLDATNIIRPLLSVITSISLDHTAILGPDIASIAKEKAGIIKTGIPLILGELPEAAESVIREQALKHQSPVLAIRERWPNGDYPQTKLFGDYQRRNAAMAWICAEQLQTLLPTDPVKRKSALLDVSWAGRWEKRLLNDGTLPLILDAAHNEEGARVIEGNLKALQQDSGHPPIIITGSLGEDRAKSLCEVLCRYTETIHLLQPKQPRALATDHLRKLIPESYRGKVVENRIEDLFSKGHCHLKPKPGQVVLVTGSIYLIGEICDALESQPPVAQQNLQDVI